MPIEATIIWLCVGAISGWLSGLILNGKGFGLLGDIIVGIVGSIVAAYLFPKFGVHMGHGLAPYITSAAVGGIVLLIGLSAIRRIL